MSSVENQPAEDSERPAADAEPTPEPTPSVKELFREFEGRVGRLEQELTELRTFFDSVGDWLSSDPAPRN